MFFSKKSGFHALVLFINSEEPHPLFVVMPSDVANDVISTMRKFEKSPLNDHKHIGNLGPFTIIQDIQDFQKISIYNDTLSWSEPILYTDFAKKITDRLQNMMDDVGEDTAEELVYFTGEFTMMQDNGFAAPF